MASPSLVPYRQIRAQHDSEFITVYQAYKDTIADAAVRAQKLNASPDFKPGRMTWVKPSWCWMMYRAGYSFKDPGQNRILALKMTHGDFLGLLESAILSTHSPSTKDGIQERASRNPRGKSRNVRIQWDPERTARLELLPYRSIQIGIPGPLSVTWATKWIASIEDVTAKARELKNVLDEQPSITTEELVELGLMPTERPYHVSEAIASGLEMAVSGQRTSVPRPRSSLHWTHEP